MGLLVCIFSTVLYWLNIEMCSSVLSNPGQTGKEFAVPFIQIQELVLNQSCSPICVQPPITLELKILKIYLSSIVKFISDRIPFSGLDDIVRKNGQHFRHRSLHCAWQGSQNMQVNQRLKIGDLSLTQLLLV